MSSLHLPVLSNYELPLSNALHRSLVCDPFLLLKLPGYEVSMQIVCLNGWRVKIYCNGLYAADIKQIPNATFASLLLSLVKPTLPTYSIISVWTEVSAGPFLVALLQIGGSYIPL